jgi:hypothetical protein
MAICSILPLRKLDFKSLGQPPFKDCPGFLVALILGIDHQLMGPVVTHLTGKHVVCTFGMRQSVAVTALLDAAMHRMAESTRQALVFAFAGLNKRNRFGMT